MLREARAEHERRYRQLAEPLVSVTIATYNRGRLLVERTLPSVFNQTYQNFEIVIVGDCCQDDTPRRIAALHDPRVRFVNLPQRGRYPRDPKRLHMVAGCVPINRARELARGDWLAYMDDDDVFTRDHIEALLEHAQKGNFEFVFARNQIEHDDGVWQESGGPSFPNGCRPFGGSAIPHRTVFYRSYLRFFRYRIDSWRYLMGSDTLVWLHMARAGVRAGFLNKMVAYKHQRANYAEAPAAVS